MRAVLAIVLFGACGASPPARPAPTAAAPPRPPVAAVPADAGKTPSAMVPAFGPPRAGIESPPSGSLHELAITPDGGAALTVDELGGVRLWPTLDGTREPRVVTLDAPVELALVRRGDGFTAATVDDGRGLALVELDAEGRTLAHRTLGNDPGVAGVAAVDDGLLVWSSDEKIALYGANGDPHGTLGTRPGERLVTLATAGAHAVAEVEIAGGDAPQRRVRALVLAPALAWGDFVDAGVAPVGAIALAPSGTRLAMMSAQDHLAVIDVARGAKLDDVAVGSGASALAFIDDAHVGIAAPSGIAWFAETGVPPKFTAAAAQPLATPEALAAGGHELVALAGGVVVIATPQQVAYLGYALEAPSVVAPGAAGALMLASGSSAALLDPTLRARGTADIGVPKAATTTGLTWIGGDDWLVQARTGADLGALRVSSMRGGASTVVAPDIHSTEILRYEPSTQLVTTSFGDQSGVYRWDPARRTVVRVAQTPKATPYSAMQIVPTAPARADGVKLVRMTTRELTTVEWFTDERMTRRTAVVEVGAVLAADASGRVYAWLTRDGRGHVAILENGREVGALPLTAAGAVFPDATGRHIAVISGTTLSVYVDGKQAWARDSHQARSVVWLADGALALVTAAGVARLDPATGAIATARCGWGFGLSTTPLAPAPALEPMCVRDEQN